MNAYKAKVAEELAPLIEGLDQQDIAQLLEYPPNPEMGDLSLPCFKLSKTLRKAPQAIAEQVRDQLQNVAWLDKVEAVSGYCNLFLHKESFIEGQLDEILSRKGQFGAQELGNGKNIVIDYSSPNIAKPFHVGHLRTTIIGNALYRIFDFLGYNVIRVNHLGDWGTQFGKLIVAYQQWGSEEQVEQDGISELFRLYVKFHDEAEREPELEEQARAWFVRLEQGDEEANRLWKWFVDISLKEFNKIYELLGVGFDSYAGESFYNDKMAPVVQELKDKKLLEEDEGAMLVRLDEFNMPPALILKKDGGTLYHTRDITAAIYRKTTYDFEKCIYVVDAGQSLHFKQWFKVVELMGYDWAEDLEHVSFGKVSLEGAKLSTRKGNVVMLEDLLTQAIAKTKEIIESKNPAMDNKEEVARQVGVGAVIFNDLSTNRVKDIVFSWDEALNFDGETGPYVQYTHARCCSVLRKANNGEGTELPAFDGALDSSQLLNDEAYAAVKQLALFPETVVQAMHKMEPSLISRYLVDLAQSFNRFYHNCPILVEDQALRQARLALVKSVQITLSNGLRLIGLESPEKI
ncbi:arginine--tRNA ligase [Paenibacillus senegalensis]|uniref:arginine--tRNA ligase n=1 Tax=Paenibacillus senegalensis TaxID=1465766 RepID=UPI0002882469|nr:arginine--tRNA ligase [Paenibacillus senegalensis]